MHSLLFFRNTDALKNALLVATLVVILSTDSDYNGNCHAKFSGALNVQR